MDLSSRTCKPVLILGAGINGSAVARELAINGVAVWVVDANDIAFGATSKSSRLIHGGLRYLEYGDFHLVRESLAERNRLRRLAPQFVEPLTLFIPVSRRTGGLLRSGLRFVGSPRWRGLSWLNKFVSRYEPRGLWVVRLGLRFYDMLAGTAEFKKSRVLRASSAEAPDVDPQRYRWLCAYTDAQIRFPERFVIAELEDARQAAAERGAEFRVLTHHVAKLCGARVEIRPAGATDGSVENLEPAAIVNATGAWGDFTLAELNVPSRRLFGGTKGSHIITYQRKLREAIRGDGLYAEASDGRLIFVLPFGEGVLIGTTDETFDARPDRAVATGPEIEYLLDMANELFPEANLTVEDVDLHYSGVRPLPPSDAPSNAAISRDHWIEEHKESALPLFTLVGGKLTTCRAFAEEVADRLFETLGVSRTADTRARPYPGSSDFPRDEAALRAGVEHIAEITGFSRAQVEAVWLLCGTRAEEILAQLAAAERESLPGTDIPTAYARWVIDHEWATTLGDLVERRLMLIYHPGLSEGCLRGLAGLLAEAGKLARDRVDRAVEELIDRLGECYGKRVGEGAADAQRLQAERLRSE